MCSVVIDTVSIHFELASLDVVLQFWSGQYLDYSPSWTELITFIASFYYVFNFFYRYKKLSGLLYS